METVIVIKSCPFCGGPGELQVYIEQDGSYSLYIRCENCGSRGPKYNEDPITLTDRWSEATDKAIEWWNEREE